jgi:glucokinase
MDTLLALDFCGQRSIVGLYELNSKSQDPIWQSTYKSVALQDVDEIITHFLKEGGLQPDFACIAVAGVKADSITQLPGNSWKLTEDKLLEKFHFVDVKLIKDITALCSILPYLEDDECRVVQKGQLGDCGMSAVFVPGQGLGQGYLLENDDTFYPMGTEGGFCLFSPANQEQMELLSYLQKKKDAVNVNAVCCISVLTDIYSFLKGQGSSGFPEVEREVIRAEDAAQVILSHGASDASCPLCRDAILLYLSLLGTEASNLVMKLSAYAGLYLGGSVLSDLVEKITLAEFMDAFKGGEATQNMLESVPVKVIMKRDAVMAGILSYCRDRYLSPSS